MYARAALRLGWRKMYAAFCKVSIEKKKFRWQAVYLQTLVSLRDAAIATAKQHHIACTRRRFEAPLADTTYRAQFAPLIEIDDSSYKISDTLAKEIDRAKAQLTTTLESEKQRRQARLAAAAANPNRRPAKNARKRTRREMEARASQ